MKLQLSLIRSGCTEEGRQGRYVGRLDGPLLEESREALRLRAGAAGEAQGLMVFSSPLLRSRETAQLLYPHTPAILLKDLTAYDYGAFTGLTYAEVVADKRFTRWAQADQMLACPDGESPYRFHSRCIAVFERIVDELVGKELRRAAVITHQSVIRTILQRYHIPRAIYQPWAVDWGEEIAVEFSPEQLSLRILKKNSK